MQIRPYGDSTNDRIVIARLLQQLVAINSINPDLVEDGPGEGEIAQFVANWLAHADLEVELVEPKPGRPNVISHMGNR